MLSKFLHLVLIVLMLVSPPAIARDYGGGGGYGGGGSSAGLSNRTTKQVIRILKRGVAACQRLERVYRYDCYRHAYRLAAQELNGRPAYGAAQAILIEVERSLARTVTQNVDPAKPAIIRGVQQYRPIKEASLPKAKAAFTRSLEEAETKLLRSAETTGPHYTRIAQAINSNKVLIRSLLDPDRAVPPVVRIV